MPRANNATVTATGAMEQAAIMLLSDAVKAFNAKTLADAIIVVIPDTGSARFNGSHPMANDASKNTKATFIVAELGNSYQGAPVLQSDGRNLTQDKGDVANLPLAIKLSVIATPPNSKGVTVDEALNRTRPVAVETPAVEKAA